MASSRSSSRSSSTNPPSEKIGVRSSCEAVATNSLRATSTRRSWLCISLNARVSWPELVAGVDGQRVDEVPGGHLLGRGLEPAHAARQRLGDERSPDQGDEQRDRAGNEQAAADERDRLGHVLEVARVERDALDLADRGERLCDLPQPLPLEARGAIRRPARAHGALGEPLVHRHLGLLARVADHVETGARGVGIGRVTGRQLDAEQGHPRVGGVRDRADLAGRARSTSHPRKALRAWGENWTRAARGPEFAARAGSTRAGNDEEVENAECRGGDGEEEQRQLVAQRAQPRPRGRPPAGAL